MSSSINLKYANYIPQRQISEKSTSMKRSLLIVVLFTLSGCPNSYNVQDSLWLELPWFEVSQPEGIHLSSWILLMQALGSMIFLCLLYIETYLTCPKLGILYFSSFVALLMTVTLAFTWHFSVDGMSVFLLLGTLVGQLVGWVQYIFVIPWITRNYNPRILSPFTSGNALLIIMLLTIQIIQEPGATRNFSPKVFYLLGATIYASTFAVCVYTFNSGIERTTPKEAVQNLEPWQQSLWLQIFPPGWRETKLYLFARLWANQLTWSAIPIALPYAAANTTKSYMDDGADYLQWAIVLSYFMMLFGYLSSYLVTGKYWIFESLAVNTIGNGIIILAAFNVGDWSSWVMRVILMIAVAGSKWSFGWIFPLILREIQRKFPKDSEVLTRTNSLWALIANIFIRSGLWMVSSGVISW